MVQIITQNVSFVKKNFKEVLSYTLFSLTSLQKTLPSTLKSFPLSITRLIGTNWKQIGLNNTVVKILSVLFLIMAVVDILSIVKIL